MQHNARSQQMMNNTILIYTLYLRSIWMISVRKRSTLMSVSSNMIKSLLQRNILNELVKLAVLEFSDPN